jgi:MFS family permease
MVGLGETNFPLFALALGKTQATAGLVATVPQLAGALLQLCAPWGVERIGSPRRWIMLCASIQFLSFGPMVLAAALGAMPTWLLFAVASLYWAVNLGAAPAWNTWIGALFPRRIRSHYFGWRSRVYQFSILGALLVGGFVLAVGDSGRAAALLGADIAPGFGVMASFAVVFALAGLSRLWSVWFLRHQSEAPRLDVRQHRRIHPWEFLKRLREGPDGRVLGAMVLMTMSVQVAQPFFVPYMSRQLGFGDASVLAMIAASFAAKSLSAPLWGAYARRHGARRLFILGAWGIVPLSLLWMVSDSFWYLLALQGLTGAMFGAFELGFFFLSLEAIRDEERTSMLAIYLVLNSFAAAAGSLIGKALLEAVPSAVAAYMAIFAASALLRLVSIAPVRRITVDVASPEPMATVPLALRPSAGSIEAPEPGTIADEPRSTGDDARR